MNTASQTKANGRGTAEPQSSDIGLVSISPETSPSENYMVEERLQQMPSLFARGLLYVVIALVATGLVYAIVGRIDIVVDCPAVAKPAALDAGVSLYMDITVPNKDIGRIEEGMEIKYKFDAFPYTDYGMRRGKVTAIAPSATERGSQGFVYTVSGSLDQDVFKGRTRNYAVKPGMTATAELVTERRNLLSILIRKIRH